MSADDINAAWEAKRAARWFQPNPQRFLKPERVRNNPWPAPKPVPPDEGARDGADIVYVLDDDDWRLLMQMRRECAAMRRELDEIRYARLLRKAYDPQQPRWPRGTPGSVGGRWSGEGGSGGDGEAVSEPTTSVDTPSEGPRLRITVRPLGIGDGGGLPTNEPLPPPPNIPENEPPSAKLRNRVVKQVARWALRTALRLPMGPVGVAITVLEVASWLHAAYPYIQAYTDPPKSLGELQEATTSRRKGYDIHHIVEQTPAERDGLSRDMIDAPENMVSISTLKHWEITGWYMRPNKRFGGLSPREFLRGKSWDERLSVGHEALRMHGVLKP